MSSQYRRYLHFSQTKPEFWSTQCLSGDHWEKQNMKTKTIPTTTYTRHTGRAALLIGLPFSHILFVSPVYRDNKLGHFGWADSLSVL